MKMTTEFDLEFDSFSVKIDQTHFKKKLTALQEHQTFGSLISTDISFHTYKEIVKAIANGQSLLPYFDGEFSNRELSTDFTAKKERKFSNREFSPSQQLFAIDFNDYEEAELAAQYYSVAKLIPAICYRCFRDGLNQKVRFIFITDMPITGKDRARLIATLKGIPAEQGIQTSIPTKVITGTRGLESIIYLMSVCLQTSEVKYLYKASYKKYLPSKKEINNKNFKE